MKRMNMLMLMSFVLFSINLLPAAITDYYLPPVASAGTYSAITGTTITGGDDVLSGALDIGFTFNYCGTAYTQVKMSSNGLLGLGTVSTGLDYVNYLASTSINPVIAPLWDDLYTDSMKYITQGSGSSHVFIAQWNNSRWNYSSTLGQNFQIRLYEASDKIELIYGAMVDPAYPSASIGINCAPGGSGCFYSITPGNPMHYSTANENASVDHSLSSGTTYTFNRSPFAGGIGTEADPYCINNASELNLIRNYLGSASSRTYFKLTSDIDLTLYGNAWVPIGNSSAYFYGGLDGNNHTISNMRYSSYGYYHGLFGVTGAGSVIKNLVLASTCYILGDDETGSIAGRNSGTVQNCSSAATVNIGNAQPGGGLVGFNTGTITGSSFTGSVSRSGGGVNANKLGGIAGYNETGAIVNNCTASGTIFGSTWNGGLVGWNNGTINSSFTTGSISCYGNSNGGLVGQNQGSINNCYSRATVAGNSYNGGLVGYHESGPITNCYSTGTVSGGQRGGLTGTTGGTVTNSYWDMQTSGIGSSYSGTGKTTAEMKLQSTFTGWDFVGETTNGTNDYWSIWASDNNGYPDMAWKYANDIRSPILLTPTNNAYGINKDSVTITWSPNPVGLATDHYTIYLIKDNPAQILNTGYANQHTYTNYTGTSYNLITEAGLTFNYGENWYWTVVAYSVIGAASTAATTQSFHIQRDQFATESFEAGCIDGTTNISEWTQVIEAQSSSWTANSTYNAGTVAPRTGTFDVYMYHSDGMPATSWLFRPVTLTEGMSYDIELYARQQLYYNNPNYGTIGIYYGTAATIAAMTNTTVGQTVLETSEYQRISGSFVAASSGTYYLGIKGYLWGSTNYLSLDDVTLSLTATNPVTLNLPANQSTFVSTLPTLSWTAPTTGAAPNAYKICISTVNPPTIADLVTVVNAPTTSYSFVQQFILQPATKYYWSIIVESANGTSTNNAVYYFTTMPLNAMMEGFEGGTIPANWTIVNNDTNTQTWEIVEFGSYTGSFNASAVSGYSNDDIWLITPPLLVTTAPNDNINFWMGSFLQQPAENWEVLVSTTDTQTASFTMIDSGTYTIHGYTYKSYSLDSYGDAVVYVAVRYIGEGYDFHVDDFRGPPVYTASANLATPTVSISSSGSTISLNWQSVTGATEYHVYSSDNLVNWSTSFTTVAAPNHTLSISAASSGKKFFKVKAYAP
ncbi:MAG: GLUG motif-containing protein [Candidatus Cloacimonetes bacterium]|nr:hypothetical protein [Candidatus Cloacimonadota bacterium]MDD3235256.1 GLUG motif-containing protein [Candidatus Cloacimonadota bacterium]